MKTIIRNNVFETNSSSSHSLSVEQNEFGYYLENLSYLINENGDIIGKTVNPKVKENTVRYHLNKSGLFLRGIRAGD